MLFHVMSRLLDPPVAPPRQEIALLKAAFAWMAEQTDPRVKAAYPFADQRATAYVVEVASGDELAALLGNIPPSRLCTWDAHPLTSPRTVLALLNQWEEALAGQ